MGASLEQKDVAAISTGVAIKLSKDLVDKIAKVARSKGMPASTFVAEVMHNYFADEKTKDRRMREHLMYVDSERKGSDFDNERG